MTVIDSAHAHTVDSALSRIIDAADEHELEAEWVAGLRDLRDPSDRDRILAAAGRRIHVFGDVVDDRLRHRWLDDVVHDLQGRAGEPLGEELSVITAAEIKEAFARAADDLATLRDIVASGQSMHDYSARSPLAAARLCDLGRMAERLRGTEFMALAPEDDVRLSRDLAEAKAFGDWVLPGVPAPLRISRDDLLAWARSGGAERDLPRLIRRLVAETAPATKVDFPAGTGTRSPGWDGIVECSSGNQFVPEGRSGWELSAQQSGSDAKARDDYAKRAGHVVPEQRLEMDYVVVMCAPWTKKRGFEQEKRSLGDFRSVTALNVDDLASWLEGAPHTTVWLRELMGKPVAGISLLSASWAKWLESTTPSLDAGVVLAGRRGPAAKLRDRCRLCRGGVITVGGPVHRDEIMAFVAAALVSPDDSDRCEVDTLYVGSHDTAERLLAAEALTVSSSHVPALTVVVPSTDFVKHLPAGSRHRMIVPLPGASQSEIVLEAADAAEAAERLLAAGVDRYDAHELGSLARMSLMALRRRLAVNPELYRPQWASGPIAETLRRSLLLHSWDQSRPGDRNVVERFVGRPHRVVAEALDSLDACDAPIILTDEIRHVVSPMDAWMLLKHQLTRNDVEAFSDAAHDVLTEPDPLHGTVGFERVQALYDGVQPKYSLPLKRGVATTLALLGSRPPALHGSVTPAPLAAGIVCRILRSAHEDSSTRTWTAVAEALPLLAEADPEAVLSGLRTCLAERHAFAQAMFEDDRDDDIGFPAPSAHLRIIEALELLAWSPDHLKAAVAALASLAVIDPGGGWSNRPAASLAAVLCPWSPNTCASLEQRLEAVGMLRKWHGPVAWPLMVSMLPTSHDTHRQGRGPRFRDWKPAEPTVSRREYAEAVEATADMLLQDVGDDPQRWRDLVKRVADLPAAARSEMVAVLHQIADAAPDEEFKAQVWPALRHVVDHHRTFSYTRWALLETELAPFDALSHRLRPAAPEIAYGHLFTSGPTVIGGPDIVNDRKAHEETVQAQRDEAVAAMLHAGGVCAVLDFAERVDQPGIVGDALARRGENLDEALLAALENASDAVSLAALRYFRLRFAEIGADGIDGLLADLSPQAAANLLRSVPAAERPWRRADALGEEVAAQYWARVSPYEAGSSEDLSELLEVSRRLRRAGRTDAARTVLILHRRFDGFGDFAEEAAACLEQWIQQDAESLPAYGAGAAWDLAELLEVVDQHRERLGTQRLARIEWLYFPLLGHHGDFRAPNLYREMAQNPEFFAWIVELAYKPASGPDEEPPTSQEPNRLAVDAFDVLRSWPPGGFAPRTDAEGGVDAEVGVDTEVGVDASDGPDNEGGVDAEALKVWVDRARERLAEVDRTGIGCVMIGTALAASPAGSDGEWPSVAVCDLIERLESDSLERGLSTAILNQRGVVGRSPNSGGAQERELAADYTEQSKRLSDWPRTAAIFAGLAGKYARMAETHDREAEAHRRGVRR